MSNEAQARLKIDRLLTAAGWRLESADGKRANVVPEEKTAVQNPAADPGADFENTKNGFIDYSLLDDFGVPVCVLEAKRESADPLAGKEQARRYAEGQNCPFVMLSNGVVHYFWNIRAADPQPIARFPDPALLQTMRDFGKASPTPLAAAQVAENFLQNKTLRRYQIAAINAVQTAAADGKTRFLLEMATGTGKTTIAAALCQLFLQTANARRVLFLVDRIELENQAEKSFRQVFGDRYFVRRNKDGAGAAQIVVSTVQSLLAGGKYRELFSPLDFDFVISDEAHRSVVGDARELFEYFAGYKLGLTATPKDYLKGADGEAMAEKNPKEWERRNHLDTYQTFGCGGGEPTFRYDLRQGAQEGHLIQPRVLDARTKITTQLLSEQGYALLPPEENKDGEEDAAIYRAKDFEVTFFNNNTSRVICETIIRRALRDPLSGEFGKTLVFCARQRQAARITNILNECARPLGYAGSDFAVQVTSDVPLSQKYAKDFANNNLRGRSQFAAATYPEYKTSKTRVCVTVGMMTTGYDCPDLLNIAFLCPVFSPSAFVQMKGRGTRKHNFKDLQTEEQKAKTEFLILDFFAVYEYFEKDFNYDEKEALPAAPARKKSGEEPAACGPAEDDSPDAVASEMQHFIGKEGMRIDRALPPHEQFEAFIGGSKTIQQIRLEDGLEGVLQYIRANPGAFPLETIRRSYEKAHNPGRKISPAEMLQKALGDILRFKTSGERVEEEFAKYIAAKNPPLADGQAPLLRRFFEVYISDARFRQIIDAQTYGDLANYPAFAVQDLQKIGGLFEGAAAHIAQNLRAEISELAWKRA